jgi:hypothetical protein
MRTINPFNIPLFLIFVLMLSLVLSGFNLSLAESSELSTAVFTVQ